MSIINCFESRIKALILSALLFVCVTLVLPAQALDDYIKKEHESSSDFVLRVTPASKQLTYQLIETYEWDAKNPSLVTFCRLAREKADISEVIGHVYMKQYDLVYYRDIVFGDFVGESEYPEILDAFWMNIDSDSDNELFVLYKYLSVHFDFTGYIYDVAVFDNPTVYADSLASLDLFGNAFVSFEGINGDGSELVPDYTTREQIIKKITE